MRKNPEVDYSSRLFFPLGAGSRGVTGDLVYVTVLVTTCLTLTDLCVPDRGASKCLVFPSITQSAGENGERIALLLALPSVLLFGESVEGDQAGDWGIRSRRKAVGVRAEFGGRMKGEGGIIGADCVFRLSRPLHMQLAALEGWVMGVDLPDMRSKMGLLPVEGVDTAGERALRNSV